MSRGIFEYFEVFPQVWTSASSMDGGYLGCQTGAARWWVSATRSGKLAGAGGAPAGSVSEAEPSDSGRRATPGRSRRWQKKTIAHVPESTGTSASALQRSAEDLAGWKTLFYCRGREGADPRARERLGCEGRGVRRERTLPFPWKLGRWAAFRGQGAQKPGWVAASALRRLHSTPDAPRIVSGLADARAKKDRVASAHLDFRLVVDLSRGARPWTAGFGSG